MKKLALLFWFIIIPISLFATNECNTTIDANVTEADPIYISEDQDVKSTDPDNFYIQALPSDINGTLTIYFTGVNVGTVHMTYSGDSCPDYNCSILEADRNTSLVLDLEDISDNDLNIKIYTCAVGNQNYKLKVVYNTYGGNLPDPDTTIVMGKVDFIDQFTTVAEYPAKQYIQTKISNYPTVADISTDGYEIDAVWVDHTADPVVPQPYATRISSIPLTVLYYLGNGNCTFDRDNDMLFTGIDDGNGRPTPVAAQIPPTGYYATSNRFLMPAFAAQDKRLIAEFVDFFRAYLESGDPCLLRSSTGANAVPGMPSCVASEEQYESTFGPLTTNKCLYDNGNPCLPTNHGYGGGRYDHMYGCYQCTLEGDAEFSCSRDNFAIRPDYFDVNTTDPHFPNLLRAGQDYNLTIYAHDYGVTITTFDSGTKDYNQTKSNMDLNQTRYFADDIIDLGNQLHGTLIWSAWDFRMTDGISNHNTSHIPITSTTIIEAAGAQYDDVGKINLSVEDREWAAVDINNLVDPTPPDCSPNGAYICGDKNVTYIPHHFGFAELNITNSAGPDTNFTYVAAHRGVPTTVPTPLPVRSKMAARVQARVQALTKDGQITQNFKSEDAVYPYSEVDESTRRYYEHTVHIDLNVTVPSSGTNTYLYPDANTSSTTTTEDATYYNYIGFGRSGSDNNGTRNILWDEVNFPLEFNFHRAMNKPANPFDVNGSYLAISLLSHYIDPEDGDTADINGSRVGDYNTTAWTACATDDGCIQQNADSNATFFYGRAVPSQDPYDDVMTSSVPTPILVNVYCNPAYIQCFDYGIYSNAQTSEFDWWLSYEHEMSKGHGNIELTVGTITPSGSATVTNNPSVSINSNAKDENVEVNATSANRPMTVNIKFVIDETLTHYTHPWMIYNPDADAKPVPFYRVIFTGQADWAGHGNTGYVVEGNTSTKKNHRLGW